MSTHADWPDERRTHEPETLRLRSISPALTVDDIHASLTWYRDVVGFTVEQEYEHEGELRGVALVAGTARLMLSQDDWAKGRDRVKGAGLRLYLTTGQDVDKMAAGITGRGAPWRPSLPTCPGAGGRSIWWTPAATCSPSGRRTDPPSVLAGSAAPGPVEERRRVG